MQLSRFCAYSRNTNSCIFDCSYWSIRTASAATDLRSRLLMKIEIHTSAQTWNPRKFIYSKAFPRLRRPKFGMIFLWLLFHSSVVDLVNRCQQHNSQFHFPHSPTFVICEIRCKKYFEKYFENVWKLAPCRNCEHNFLILCACQKIKSYVDMNTLFRTPSIHH